MGKKAVIVGIILVVAAIITAAYTGALLWLAQTARQTSKRTKKYLSLVSIVDKVTGNTLKPTLLDVTKDLGGDTTRSVFAFRAPNGDIDALVSINESPTTIGSEIARMAANSLEVTFGAGLANSMSFTFPQSTQSPDIGYAAAAMNISDFDQQYK